MNESSGIRTAQRLYAGQGWSGMMRMVIGRRIGLQGIALCCCLLFVARPCAAQTQGAEVTPRDAPAIAPVPSTVSADLPSAPVPNNQMVQTGDQAQATGTAQQQQTPPSQEGQTKPGT